MKAGELARLVGLSPGTLEPHTLDAFLPRASAALDAGLPVLLLREPLLTDADRLRAGEWLRERHPRAQLWIHDALHLAAMGPFDALHLGFRSLPPATARRLLGPSARIGFSAHAHDPDGAWRECDHLFASPVLETPSKRGLLEPLGWTGLRELCARASVPVFALGGLRAEHVAAARAQGAHGLAVRGALFDSPDAAAAAGEFLLALASCR